MKVNYKTKTESFLCSVVGKEIKVTYEIENLRDINAFDTYIDIIEILELPEDEEFSIKDVKENLYEQIRFGLWKKSFFDADDKGCDMYHDLKENWDNF